MTCNNCGATLTCGCQKRGASDGKSCCTTCITKYEMKLSGYIPTEKKSVISGPTEPIIPGKTYMHNFQISNKPIINRVTVVQR